MDRSTSVLACSPNIDHFSTARSLSPPPPGVFMYGLTRAECLRRGRGPTPRPSTAAIDSIPRRAPRSILAGCDAGPGAAEAALYHRHVHTHARACVSPSVCLAGRPGRHIEHNGGGEVLGSARRARAPAARSTAGGGLPTSNASGGRYGSGARGRAHCRGRRVFCVRACACACVRAKAQTRARALLFLLLLLLLPRFGTTATRTLTAQTVQWRSAARRRARRVANSIETTLGPWPLSFFFFSSLGRTQVHTHTHTQARATHSAFTPRRSHRPRPPPPRRPPRPPRPRRGC